MDKYEPRRAILGFFPEKWHPQPFFGEDPHNLGSVKLDRNPGSKNIPLDMFLEQITIQRSVYVMKQLMKLGRLEVYLFISTPMATDLAMTAQFKTAVQCQWVRCCRAEIVMIQMPVQALPL